MTQQKTKDKIIEDEVGRLEREHKKLIKSIPEQDALMMMAMSDESEKVILNKQKIDLLKAELKGRKEALAEKGLIKIEDVLEITNADKFYPKDVFPEVTKKQLSQITNYLEQSQGFTLDRLSAHISRQILNGLNKQLKSYSQETKSELSIKPCLSDSSPGNLIKIEDVEKIIDEQIENQNNKECKLDKEETDCLPCYTVMVLEYLKQQLQELKQGEKA